ncbi:MAG TPA: hypothetical protein VG225_03225 [Terracidiphilus sp.]|jgi:hypothetical protein|nr:hypothetical protein [Terracidiphilus sp.]
MLAPDGIARLSTMTKSLDSDISQDTAESGTPLPPWIKVSAVAAASAVAGGLAAAWFYRKTLARLQHAENDAISTNFGISERESDDEI